MKKMKTVVMVAVLMAAGMMLSAQAQENGFECNTQNCLEFRKVRELLEVIWRLLTRPPPARESPNSRNNSCVIASSTRRPWSGWSVFWGRSHS